MNDLQQVSICLKQATDRSLVIIDEFGKGTNESGLAPPSRISAFFLTTYLDGVGLACGIFEYLLNLASPAKVIAATHFHEIFENNFLASRRQLHLGHMEIQVCEESPEFEDQITYLYKYVQLYLRLISFDVSYAYRSKSFRPGRSNKSFGTMYVLLRPTPDLILPGID